MKRVLIELALILAAFLIGYWPSQRQAEQARLTCVETQQQLQSRLRDADAGFRLPSLHAELGMVLIEVEENNFGRARDRATRFFDRVRETISTIQDPSQANRLKALLARRDELNADLITASPGVVTKLRQIYTTFGGTANQPVDSK